MISVIIGIFLLLPIFTLWQLLPSRIVRLGLNSWIGMRSPSTTSSEHAWSAAHYAAWPTVKYGCTFSLAALAAAFVASLAWAGTSEENLSALAAIGALIVYLIVIIFAFVKADTAAKKTEI